MTADYFNAPKTLMELPTTRAAYSDRTAWLMSEMSALAYLPFEGDHSFNKEIRLAIDIAKDLCRARGKKEIVDKISDMEKRLQAYLDKKMVNIEKQSRYREELQAELGKADFTLIKTFDEGGTQAFLATRDRDKVAVLAFRGTEANSWQDIKADLDARFFKSEGGEKVHSGFIGAFKYVQGEVKIEVGNLTGYSLYITGHSLGGALAVIAAKVLERDTLAACYTFGSPRVGNEEFGEEIKAPVYRVVNAADGVPRVPLSWLIDTFAFVIGFVNSKLADSITDRFAGYRHYGDMRYLTACNGSFSKLKVIENLGLVFRAYRLCRRVTANGLPIAGKDHRISEYCSKLKHYAQKRAGE